MNQPSVSMSDKLMTASILVLVALVLLAPAIRDAISEESAKYVNDSESAHDGLPSEWNDEQVICVLFPDDFPHSIYSSGVTMLDADGLVIGVNENYNVTGACVGGFSVYSDGMEFMLDATRVAGGHLAVGYEVGDWGPYVHTIGGLNDAEVTGDFSGAYWELHHNGEMSCLGIGDVILSEGDVILWRIGTW